MDFVDDGRKLKNTLNTQEARPHWRRQVKAGGNAYQGMKMTTLCLQWYIAPKPSASVRSRRKTRPFNLDWTHI